MRLPGSLTASLRQLGCLPYLHGLRPGHSAPVGRLDGQRCSALAQEAAPVAMHACTALDDDGRPEAALAPGVCPRQHASDTSLHPRGSPQRVDSLQCGACKAVLRVAPVQHCGRCCRHAWHTRHRCMAVMHTRSQPQRCSACSAHANPLIRTGLLAAPQSALDIMLSGQRRSPTAGQLLLMKRESAAWQCSAQCLRCSRQGSPQSPAAVQWLRVCAGSAA